MSAVPGTDRVTTLLLDADGSLFPSEEPAFVASADVTNRLLGWLGVGTRYTPEHLLATTTGKNFRTTAVDLAVANGVAVDPALLPTAGPTSTPPPTPPATANGERGTLTEADLDHWVAEEKRLVSDHLARVLRPDPDVLDPLRRLATRYRLAAVSSSALSRLDACFRATGLDELLPAGHRFSAEDSLPRPTSKPDPAVYLHAMARLGVGPEEGLAVEDSVPGAQSATSAGLTTVGNLAFVAGPDRTARRTAFSELGVTAVIGSWSELADSLLEGTPLPRP